MLNARKIVIRACDWIIWTVSLLVSCFLLERSGHTYVDNAFLLMLGYLAVHILVFEVSGIYKSIWRYLSGTNILKGIVFEGIAVVIIVLVTVITKARLRTLFVFAFAIEAVIWTGSRIIYSFLYEHTHINHSHTLENNKKGKRTLIVGGGEAARMLLNEVSRYSISDYRPICIVDDDTSKVGRYIENTKVVGQTSNIKDVCHKYEIEIIIFAIYNIPDEKKKAILNVCAELNLPVKILPHYANFVNNRNKIDMVRDVSINDLLGRKRAHIDNPMINEFLEGKTVLVTGGGGSIGGELSRQIAKYNPKRLIVLDVYENGAYFIQQNILRSGFKNLSVEIVSITDKQQMEDIFIKYKPDIVYHAAAHKHVPLMEDCPVEAVKNNVFGTEVVVDLSDKYKVKKFVMVSTDKAVNPTNVMGATKRACELIVKSKNDISETSFVAVRFGNVLGSNGSVIPLFKEQIKKGGPVTVTSPDCIRYFMTIPEAVELLLTAGSLANGGETFVLDMGDPVKIDDLARKMISLSGFVPDVDIKVEYIGMRPGEKMYEELLVDTSEVSKTCSEKIFVDKPEIIDRSDLYKKLETMRGYAEEGNREETVEMLKKTVPTFISKD